jgi:hypothetical protein
MRGKKSAAQVEETLEQLHENCLVWRNASPHALLIHAEPDDAYLITVGWIDLVHC